MADKGKVPGHHRHAIRRVLLGFLGLLVLIAILIAGGLSIAPVRKALFGRVAAIVERKTGARIEAGSVTVNPLSGGVHLKNVRYGVAGKPPLATAKSLDVVVRVSSLRSATPILDSVRLVGLHVDLSAPIPKPPAAATPRAGGPPLELPVEIRQIEIRQASVDPGARAPGAAAPWRIDKASLDGRYVGGRGWIALKSADLRVSVPNVGVRTYVLAATASTEPAGTVSLPSLTLAGSGVDVSGHARLGITPDAPVSGAVRLRADLSTALAPGAARGMFDADASLSGTLGSPRVGLVARGHDLAAAGVPPVRDLSANLVVDRREVVVAGFSAVLSGGGSAKGKGRYRFGGRSGSADVVAESVPAEVLERFLPPAAFRKLSARGTRVDFSAKGDFSAESAAGNFRLGWKRGSETLVAASGTLSPGARRVRLAFSATLLPSSVGERRASGAISAVSLGALARGTIERAHVDVATPDLKETAGDLSRAFPGLLSSLPIGGALRASADLSGPLRDPRTTADVRWTPAPATDQLVTIRFSGRPVERRGTIAVEIPALDLAAVRESMEGRISGEFSFSGSARRFTAAADFRGEGLGSAGSPPAVDSFRLSVRGDEREVTVSRLSAAAGVRRIEAAGRFSGRAPFRDADFDVTVERPVAGLAAAQAKIAVRAGVLTIDAPDLDFPGAAGSIALRVPLGSLRGVPALSGAAAVLPAGLPRGPLTGHATIPAFDSKALLASFGRTGVTQSVRGAVSASFSLDPADLPRAAARLEIAGLALDTGVAVVHSDAPVAIALSGGRIRLAPVDLVGAGTRLRLSGSAELPPRWGAGAGALVRGISVSAEGTTDASLLDPFLAGGVAKGPLALRLSLAGPTISAATGELVVRGPEARFFWGTPYASQLTDADFDVRFSGGAATIVRGNAKLNSGTLAITGGYARGGTLDVSLKFHAVRYILAYGLAGNFSGDLRFLAPPLVRRRLAGTIVLDRGVADRDVNLDREILTRLFAPPVDTGSASTALASIEVAITLKTATGIKVKNNIADLHATWGAITIRGTLFAPVIEGVIRVEPGGFLFAYNQTFRIDRAVITYTGNPFLDPKIDAKVTSSLQDPSIQPPNGVAETFGWPDDAPSDTVMGSPGATTSGPSAADVGTGVAGYFGERLINPVGQALGLSRVTIRPVLVYGQEDPGTRLTLARDLSRQLTFGVSLDLTNAERRTYLLDWHNVSGFSAMSGQFFTDDSGTEGTAVLRRHSFGGSGPLSEKNPPLGKIHVDAPKRISARKVRNAVGLEKEDPVRSTAAFDSEVSVESELRRLGYPDAEVSVTTAPSAKKHGHLDLFVKVVPGPKTRYVFTGDKPPRGGRREIASLYRGDFYEAPSIEEMKRRTVRVFRAKGHLHPKVEITVARSVPSDPGSDRVVTIASEAGKKVRIKQVLFPGLPSKEADEVASRFRNLADAAEIAVGTPESDRRFSDTLAALALPEARIVSRRLSDDGKLRVTVDPGPWSCIADVSVAGLRDEDREALAPLLPASESAARADTITAGRLVIEDDFKARGFADVNVQTVLRPTSPETTPPLELSYTVDPGPDYRVDDVRYEGLKSASPRFLAKVDQLKEGRPYREGDVDDSHSAFAALGIFSSVRSETEKKEGGLADVLFRFREKPRYTLGYGVQWESGVGLGGLVDLMDIDLFGRAITLGVRGLYLPDDYGGRVYVNANEFLGTPDVLESYFERRRLTQEKIVTDSSRGTLQLSRPLDLHTIGRGYFRYLRTTVSAEDPTANPTAGSHDAFPYLGVQYVFDSRQEPVLGGRGWFVSGDLSGTGAPLSSEFPFVRLFVQANRYQPLGRWGGATVTWAQSVRVGLAKAFRGELDPSLRFFAGGEYSIRGYRKNSLGPLELVGNQETFAGGPATLVVNEELRFPIVWRIHGVVFGDLGNVWESVSRFGQDLATSAGVGLRGLTPFGIVRIDFAKPLNPRPEDPAYKVYVGLGESF